MKNKKIIIIDQTMREGMQYRGIVFSTEQRKKILHFQEALGVDICQAGYPPAHSTEEKNIKLLQDIVEEKEYGICIAALARAYIKDVPSLIRTGIRDFHLHAHIKPDAPKEKRQALFQGISATVEALKNKREDAIISLAMLDIGAADDAFLFDSAGHLMKTVDMDILSLPDTSGILAPEKLYAKIKPLSRTAQKLGRMISVHCHNDLGLASANTLAGVSAGASAVEVSALGIGERNGIGDLFTVGRMLNHQGYEIRLRTDDTETFRKYYQYVSDISLAQTGEPLLNYNTPFFGKGVKTHVAGTHADTAFGVSREEDFYLNLLCGRHLVKKYLESRQIPYSSNRLNAITENIKSTSAEQARSLTPDEIRHIAGTT